MYRRTKRQIAITTVYCWKFCIRYYHLFVSYSIKDLDGLQHLQLQLKNLPKYKLFLPPLFLSLSIPLYYRIELLRSILLALFIYSQDALITLLPRVADLVRDRDIPVIAAGGIVDERGYVAALALGAQGVCLGTRYETFSLEVYKELVLHSVWILAFTASVLEYCI